MSRRPDPPAENEDAVVAELRRRRQRWGASKRLAHEIGVSTSILCRVARGQLAPSERVAAGLGFRKVVRWEKA